MSLQIKNPPTGPGTSTGQAKALPGDGRLDDLAQIIDAYNQVTDKLQKSHETLQDEVLRLRRELASTNAQLQRSKRLSALGEMAAGIAHEIRNPLAAIQLYASMVLEDLRTASEDSQKQAANSTSKIAAAVHGLNAIVTDVLSFARETEPDAHDLPVIDVFNRAIEGHYPAIDHAQVTIERADLADVNLMVYGDTNLLHQCLLNLLRNAVEAMADRPGPRVLTTSAADEGDFVTLTIRDTGPGIAEDARDRIFNPFFTTRDTGTGLGLAIVHRIVDAHGGTIEVSNGPDDAPGAIFKLTLPSNNAAIDATAGRLAAAHGAEAASEHHSTPGAAA